MKLEYLEAKKTAAKLKFRTKAFDSGVWPRRIWTTLPMP